MQYILGFSPPEFLILCKDLLYLCAEKETYKFKPRDVIGKSPDRHDEDFTIQIAIYPLLSVPEVTLAQYKQAR